MKVNTLSVIATLLAFGCGVSQGVLGNTSAAGAWIITLMWIFIGVRTDKNCDKSIEEISNRYKDSVAEIRESYQSAKTFSQNIEEEHY